MKISNDQNFTECLSKLHKLDCEYQHLLYYNYGYRESILTLIHGDIDFDVDRFSPDSARRNSYDEGWNDAISDYNQKK